MTKVAGCLGLLGAAFASIQHCQGRSTQIESYGWPNSGREVDCADTVQMQGRRALSVMLGASVLGDLSKALTVIAGRLPHRLFIFRSLSKNSTFYFVSQYTGPRLGNADEVTASYQHRL